MNPTNNASNDRSAAVIQPKKNYQAPAVKVYGDVRDLTGSGPTTGVHDMSLSAPHFS